MNIKQKFIELTSRTYPHGTESEVYDLLGLDNYEIDSFGNISVSIGDSDVMFTSHLDTATSKLTSVNHVIKNNIIKTDGKSILGADDKAGVVVMLYMIENKVPGLYYFFLGEEVGCLGSKEVSQKHRIEKIEGIKKVVSFDRRGTDSVITFQSYKRCASDEFGEALSKELNRVESSFKYKTDPTGVLTDSVQFTDIYPECTNISVGYYSEHTNNESQDIVHLEKLAKACTKIDWKGLPAKRDTSKVEYRSYGGYGRYGGGWDYDYYDSSYSTSSSSKSYKSSRGYSKDKTVEKIWFYDEQFQYLSYVKLKKVDGKYTEVNISKKRMTKEKVLIDAFLDSIDLIYESLNWDGLYLEILYNSSGYKTKCSRNDLVEYIPELDLKDLIQTKLLPN